MIRLFHLKSLRCNEQASFLVTVVIMMLMLTGIGVAIAGLAAEQYAHARIKIAEQNALSTAEAGIEQSVQAINGDDSFSGYPSAQQLFDNAIEGTGTFVTTVSAMTGSNAKQIVSTGTVNAYGTSRTLAKRSVRVTIVGTGSSGYSVAVGPGGLSMTGSATVTNSEVYVDGKLSFTNSGAHIGTDADPATVYVANDACPSGSNPGASYPTTCSDAPIYIPDWASVGIVGTTCATGQTQSRFPTSNSKQQIRAGTGSNGGSGLVIGCTAPSKPTITYNRAGVISAISTTTASTGAYKCNGSNTITYPANTEITDPTVTWNSGCTFVISGNLYIPGNLLMDGGAIVKIADSVGGTRPVIVVDGTITMTSGSILANSSGTGADFVSFKNSTGDPSVASLSGNDLYNSSQQQNVVVSGGGRFPGMIFDAYWSKAVLGAGGNVGAIAGQAVNMSGGTAVIFGTELSSGSKTWTITSYQQIPNP